MIFPLISWRVFLFFFLTLHSKIRDVHRSAETLCSSDERRALFSSCESCGQVCTRKSETGTAPQIKNDNIDNIDDLGNLDNILKINIYNF